MFISISISSVHCLLVNPFPFLGLNILIMLLFVWGSFIYLGFGEGSTDFYWAKSNEWSDKVENVHKLKLWHFKCLLVWEARACDCWSNTAKWKPLQWSWASHSSSLGLFCKMGGLGYWSQSPYNLFAERMLYKPLLSRHCEIIFCPILNLSPRLDI